MSMDSDHHILSRLQKAESLGEVLQVYEHWRNWGNDDEVGDEIRQKISVLRAKEIQPQLVVKKQQEEAE
jgi:hypothetical protein